MKYTYNNMTTSQDGIERTREEIKKFGQVFTPDCIIQRMMDMVSDQSKWSDPSATFLDPCMGTGNIILAMMCRRLNNGVSIEDVVKTTYGVELMQYNVDLCRARISELIGTHEYDDIIKHNIVCCDFFKWNFEEWREKTAEELEIEEQIKKQEKKAKAKATREAKSKKLI